MGLFRRLSKKKKEQAPCESDALPCIDENDEAAFSALDFQQSQDIYDRNLIGVLTYEIEVMPLDAGTRSGDIIAGEFIEMTEGRMELGIRVRTGCENLFDCREGLSLSYSRYGESFFVEARIIKTTGNNKETIDAPDSGDTDSSETDKSAEQCLRWEYCIVEVLLCVEPVRHRREHGRVAIEWNVYYCVNQGEQGAEDSGQRIEDEGAGDGGCEGLVAGGVALCDADFPQQAQNYSVTKTIDISEGGFKSIVEKQLSKNTEIKCMVEVDNHTKSEGVLTGRVVRCDYLADSIELFEMTVQFLDMDESVRAFLVDCIKKEHPGEVDSEAIITISDDHQEATIELTTPRNNGADLSYEALCDRLSVEGVTYGIDCDALRALSEKPHYNLNIVIARGNPPTDGEDAVLTYFVEMNPVLAPRVLTDGSVDFKDLGLIQQVNKDAVLVEKTPHTEGIPGTYVTGKPCEATPGRDIKLPAGANTRVNEEETALLADMDGGVSIVDDKINVFDTYVVDGDVHYETGNVSHNGIIVVKGDVRHGFVVDGTGDVMIQGTVESAVIKSGGSLVIQGGCIGEENLITAGGNVAAKFIEGGSYSIRGDLKTTYIIGSSVKCGGTIDMIGSGIIRNSHVIAQSNINAKVIGSMRSAADKTVVEVGNDPELLNRYLSASKKLEQLDKDIESFETTIRVLTVKKYKNELSVEKLKALEKAKVFERHYAIQHEELVEECRVLKAQINELGYGAIRVHNTAYEGLRIIIGSSTLVLKDSVKAVKFHRNEEGITFSPLK